MSGPDRIASRQCSVVAGSHHRSLFPSVQFCMRGSYLIMFVNTRRRFSAACSPRSTGDDVSQSLPNHDGCGSCPSVRHTSWVSSVTCDLSAYQHQPSNQQFTPGPLHIPPRVLFYYRPPEVAFTHMLIGNSTCCWFIGLSY